MAQFLWGLVICLSWSGLRADPCNDTLVSAGNICGMTAIGGGGAQPNLTTLCDDPSCNAALLAVNTTCASDPRGQHAAVLLPMCNACGRAVMQVGTAASCLSANAGNGPDPAKVCTPACQPLFCNAVASCPAGSTWPGHTAQMVSQQMAQVRTWLSNCSCATTTPTTTTTTSTTTTTTKVRTCSAPFKSCGAWGDPHYTKSFFNARFDFMGLGLFRLATSTDNSVELQAFQCRFGGSRAAVFAGFALKVAGSTMTVLGQNVSVDGSLQSGSSHPMGLAVARAGNGMTIDLDSPDNCVHFTTRKNVHSWSPGYYHNMNVEIASSMASSEGVCGSTGGRQPLQRNESLFSDSELTSLCSMCGMTNCLRRLGGRQLAMNPPADWIPVNTAKEACEVAKISYNDAASKCQHLQEDVAFFEACIYDYCASDGDDTFVENAVQSKEREVERADKFKEVPTEEDTTTTKALRGDMSFALTGAFPSIATMLTLCFLFSA